MPLFFLRASGSRPRSCWHASIHWSRVGRDCAAGVRERPEPQGCPGVHDPAQSLVGAVRLGEGLLDLLAGDGLRVARVVAAPERDVAPGLGLGDLEAAQRDLPQGLDAVREFDQCVDLLLWSASP